VWAFVVPEHHPRPGHVLHVAMGWIYDERLKRSRPAVQGGADFAYSVLHWNVETQKTKVATSFRGSLDVMEAYEAYEMACIS
jgi:hypothetical protein